ncbi:TetR/AcrR family transcriptional regulator [Antarcticimicrobium luteum]|uniref:TetR/AcrR family transcriptional regulator n=1 Tax=Antarcticimicrobium luteum TaxID=2547397 RepID=A0A4R5VFM4_9RHOB|nr:TetR/AcrR family transcriptional regulator [Antarcticimicrobium luteum]TDK50564.1 TetR/AcrR family transcriptional regulator [Antarcticimicrobium luteum]
MSDGGRKRGRGPGRTTREDWLRVALEVLVTDGIDGVRVLDLARKLDCARSSFYWYFENRDALLDALLAHWQSTNTRALVESAGAPAETINFAVAHLMARWVGPGQFDTPLDLAVRDWSRRSARVRRAVQASDAARIAAIAGMFARFGYPAAEAEVRGQILYFHQFGYDALDRREDWQTRLSRSRDYLYCLTGVVPKAEEVAALNDEVRAALQGR